jgi:hypothetical protein
MKTTRFLITASILLAITLTFSCSSEGDNDGPSTPPSLNKFVAEQSPYIGKDKIKYSYSYEGYDFYYIHLGKLRNIPLFSHPAQHHNGMNSIYTVEITETIKNNTAETIKNSSQTTINVVDEYTTSTTTGGKISAEIKADIKVLFGLIKIEGPKAADELYMNDYIYNSKITDTRQTTSLENTITIGTEYTKSTMESRTWNFTKDDKIGYYRYTLFSISDVYLYVIKDSTGAIYYEFREYVIPSSLTNNAWVLDYSEDGNFEKSDSTGFEFDISVLDNLPQTDTLLTDTSPSETDPPLTDIPVPVEHIEYTEFTTAGSHAYTFNEKFPATIEVYALGAGGGGQGGHSWNETDSWKCGFLWLSICTETNYFNGTGGAGGGGAAAYMKLIVEEPVAFNIEVGKGGRGGSSRPYESWGINGYIGGETKITWGTNNIAVKGGGEGNGSGLIGGSGGTASIRPAIIPNDIEYWRTVVGNNGTNGSKTNNIQSIGGSAAKLISMGNLTSFGGGSGAIREGTAAQAGGGGYGGYSNNEGGSGGDGGVLIVVTYFK